MVSTLPDAATSEMKVAQTSQVMSGNLLEKIGKPDHSGWLMKKGEKYNSWKQRYFVLKGVHLYYLKSETVRIISLVIGRSLSCIIYPLLMRVYAIALPRSKR